MSRRKQLSLGISLLIILSILLFAFSCSQPSTTSSPNQPVTDEQLTKEQPTDLYDVITSDPAKVDNSKLPITPLEGLNVTGHAPEVNITKYRLTIDGLVDTPLTLTYEEVKQYPTVTEVVLLICPGVFADNAEWTGVEVTTLLTKAGIKPQASQITFHALDGYSQSLSLEEVQQEGVFLAHTVNKTILPEEHGYPLRLVVREKYGNKWVKWVERIQVG